MCTHTPLTDFEAEENNFIRPDTNQELSRQSPTVSLRRNKSKFTPQPADTL